MAVGAVYGLGRAWERGVCLMKPDATDEKTSMRIQSLNNATTAPPPLYNHSPPNTQSGMVEFNWGGD